MSGQIRQAVRDICGPNGAEYISVAVSEEVSATLSEMARMTGTTEDFISRQIFDAAIQEAAGEVQIFVSLEGGVHEPRGTTPSSTVELAVLEGESEAESGSAAEAHASEAEVNGASGTTTKPRKSTSGTRGGARESTAVDGKFVKQLRTEASLSQRTFAQQSGISLDAVRRIEGNVGGVRRPTIKKLAKFFGLSEEALLVKN